MKITKKGYKNKHEIVTKIFLKKKKRQKREYGRKRQRNSLRDTKKKTKRIWKNLKQCKTNKVMKNLFFVVLDMRNEQINFSILVFQD